MTVRGRHATVRAIQSVTWVGRSAAFAAIAGSAMLAAFAFAGAGSAATTAWAKNGSYTFASNEANGNWQMNDTPISDSAGTETLGAGGVTLTASGNNAAKYGSAAVVVPLGKLSTLFDSSGNYVPPKIVSTGAPVAVNLYFDTNGDGYPLSFSYNGGVYEGPGGDNLASMEASPVANFTTFQQGNTCLSGQMQMTAVLAAYATGKCVASGGKTTNPEVWAWVGVQSSSTSTVTSTVSSVHGQALTQSSTATGGVSTFVNYSASCIDNTAGNWVAGNKIQLWKCGANGGTNQQFRIVSYSDGTGQLQSVPPAGKPAGPWCVASSVKAAQLTIQPCDSTTTVKKTGAVYAFPTGLVMDDSGFNTANGSEVVGYTPTGGRNQEWSLP